MSKLHASILSVKLQLIKEISGFINLFGEQISETSPQQQTIPAKEHFGNNEVKVKDITILQGAKLNTPQLKRIIASESDHEKIVGLSHTWDETGDISLDDLVSIHLAFQAKLDDILHRNND
jgi:hypothetical protein